MRNENQIRLINTTGHAANKYCDMRMSKRKGNSIRLD
jgi:hypothetical protein